MKHNIKTCLGIGLGAVTYDWISNGIDGVSWGKALFIAVFAFILMRIFALKKDGHQNDLQID
jgi:hypothetical protein